MYMSMDSTFRLRVFDVDDKVHITHLMHFANMRFYSLLLFEYISNVLRFVIYLLLSSIRMLSSSFPLMCVFISSILLIH